MSRQPSPGPSNMHAAPTGGATTIVISNAQSAGAGGGQKAKAKPYVGGITAGVEDMKYHAKYKELKRKVKEIEVVSFLCLVGFGCAFWVWVGKGGSRAGRASLCALDDDNASRV